MVEEPVGYGELIIEYVGEVRAVCSCCRGLAWLGCTFELVCVQVIDNATAAERIRLLPPGGRVLCVRQLSRLLDRAKALSVHGAGQEREHRLHSEGVLFEHLHALASLGCLLVAGQLVAVHQSQLHTERRAREMVQH